MSIFDKWRKRLDESASQESEDLTPQYYGPDTAVALYYGSGADDYYDLTADPTQISYANEVIRRHLRNWMIQDQALTEDLTHRHDTSLSHNFNDFDLKYLPYPSYSEALLECVQDTAGSGSGGRFFDAIVHIYMEVDPATLETITGRFLYAMIYGLGREVNNRQLPSKKDWLDTIRQFPWAPFIAYVQELSDTEENDEVLRAVHSPLEPTVANDVQSFRQDGR